MPTLLQKELTNFNPILQCLPWAWGSSLVIKILCYEAQSFMIQSTKALYSYILWTSEIQDSHGSDYKDSWFSKIWCHVQ